MSRTHAQRTLELEKDETVELEFTDGTTLTATVISPYGVTPGTEILFDANGYENVLSVKAGETHEPAIIRPGLESFGYVKNVY